MKLPTVFTVGFLLVRAAHAAPSSFPVCIVGTGPAGLVAATKLEAKGYDVVMFEKQSAVGGKSQSYYDEVDGSYHPLGGLLFSNGTYTESLKIIAQTSILSVPFNSGTRYIYNYTTGETWANPAPSAAFVTLLRAEYQRYAVFWNTEWLPYNAMRYKNGVPTEYTVTCAEWLSTNQYQALPVLFIQAMVNFGYGDYRELPILYMLTYLTPDVLGYFASIHEAYLIDFHAVFLEYSQSIKGSINLATHITQIDRTGSNPIISYQTGSVTESILHDLTDDIMTLPRNAPVFDAAIQTQTCSSVVLAFPPAIKALTAANLELTSGELDVFSPVLLNAYYSAAVNVPPVPSNVSFQAASANPMVPAPADGEPVFWLRLFPDSPIATTWSWSSVPNPANAYSLLKSTLSMLNRDPSVAESVAVAITDSDIRAFAAPDYFPHYNTAALQDGIYERYNALQGQNNTYYCSALDGFEIVEFALRAGIDLIDSYF